MLLDVHFRDILSETKSETRLDYAVGGFDYGTDPVGGDYWLVKSSWRSS